MGSPAEYRLAFLCGCLTMVCFLVPVQQAIRDHPDEEGKAQSGDGNADNLHDEVARASDLATLFHDYEATAKEVPTSMSLVGKYVQKGRGCFKLRRQLDCTSQRASRFNAAVFPRA